MRNLVRAVLLSVTAALFGAFALFGAAQAEPDGKIPGTPLRPDSRFGHRALAADDAYGPFVLANVASGACLDQDYTDGVPHTTLYAWECNGGLNQTWYLEVRESDYSVVFKNGASGDCLDQDYTDGVPHTSILVWPCNGGDNQRWYLYEAADGSGAIIARNVASGHVLDQDYTDGVPHVKVTAWPYNEGGNQLWQLL